MSDWRHDLSIEVQKAMRASGLTREQMADVLRRMAYNLTKQAAKEGK